MSSEKVLIMPIQTPERPSRLRREENPPYPEDAVAILRSALDMHQEIGGMKQAIEGLQATSRRQAETLDEVGREAHSAKITMRVLIGVGIVIAGLIGWAIATYITVHPGR
jgi:hypothetical protein